MNKFAAMAALGMGLSLGGGLVYFLMTNQMAMLLFGGMFLFIMGGALIGLVLLANNRMWANAVFGSNRSETVKNSYNYRFTPPVPASGGLLPAAPVSSLPDYVEFPPPVTETRIDDEAMA